MKNNLTLNSISLALLCSVSFFDLQAMNTAKEGMEISASSSTASASAVTKQKTSIFEEFESVSVKEYIEKCMPNLPVEKKKDAVKVFDSLLKSKATPIQEDDAKLNLKIKTEGGYSFPPSMEMQGPFLKYCGTGSFKRILDIGGGKGDDTISCLMTRNAQVISVDIQQNQLNELGLRVEDKLEKSFPEIFEKKWFSKLKRNFATKGSVPTAYMNAINGVNMSRVAHFLNGEELSILVDNLASMMKDGAWLSLTVSTIVPDSREAQWIEKQTQQGLKDPGLVYYETIKTIRKNGVDHLIIEALPKTFAMVNRKTCQLPSPGHKMEFMEENKTAWTNTMIQGRYYHTLESLKSYLEKDFDIVDSKVTEWDDEDKFLSVIAERKPRQ
ncbi:Putative methyltransferase [Candidatus Bealeia paramacronuclearis]|uniref:Methyltransferase n=1 Tax=Candidatus Bealeia paramacronuclearis TaxID=1921001 RepID=A0ABZ2C6R2_9PROT|nr:putative methyltransferase [Candidatus Bealeia paramacronuclearis]